VRRQIHLGQERQRAPLLVRPHKELRVQPRNNLLDLQHGLRVQHTALPEVLLAVQCQVVAVQLEAPAAVAVVLEAVEQDNFFNRYPNNMMLGRKFLRLYYLKHIMRIQHLLFTSLLLSGLGFSAHGQSVGNGLIFSQETNGGTARFKGLGNAKTALGGDISSITGNPAGLGFFGLSNTSVKLNYNNAANKGSYFGNSISKNKGKFGIDHAGVVFHFPKNEGYHGWQNFNVGISYENTNQFSNNVRYEGLNPNNTIVSAYTDDIANFGDQA